MAIKTLSRRFQDIQIGDRRFRLNEFTLDQLHHYLDQVQAIAPKAVEALGDDPVANYHRSLEVTVAEGEQLILWLLREPIDGLPVPDLTWYRANVTPAIQRAVQEEAYDLNGLESLLGETMRLLEATRNQQAPTGLNTSIPSPTDTEPTP